MGRLVHKRPMIHMDSESVWRDEGASLWVVVVVMFAVVTFVFVPGAAELGMKLLEGASYVKG